jgi:hypothetical protein
MKKALPERETLASIEFQYVLFAGKEHLPGFLYIALVQQLFSIYMERLPA